MFESIADRLRNALGAFQKSGKLTEQNVKDGMREVRKALLEADVQYDVVRAFIKDVTAKAIGEDVIGSVEPGQMIIKIVQDELTNLMGPVAASVNYAEKGPTVIMMVGLQGSGKTTSSGKLARYFRSKGRHPLLVAADIQRPAAIDQLETLGKELDIPVYAERGGRPAKICQRAIAQAKDTNRNVVILDTAGRLHIDDALMQELDDIRSKVGPHETFLVCDAMTGQDAVVSAKEFNERLDVTGVILTKMDGDARGGAALSIKKVTGKPIRFMGVGEKLDRLEEFHPDRVAGRILGMGDIVTLVERAQEAQTEEEAQERAEKLFAGTFTLEDFLEQMQTMKKMGPMKDLMKMIPGMGEALQGQEIDDGEFGRMEAMIHSMTPLERVKPEDIDNSRRKRIARGSGTNARQVRDLVTEFMKARKMMKMMTSQKGGGLMGMMGRRHGRKQEKAKLRQLAALKKTGKAKGKLAAFTPPSPKKPKSKKKR